MVQRKRLAASILLACIASAIAFSCRSEAKDSAQAALKRVRLPSGSYSLKHGGRLRRYHVHLPNGREQEDKLPLMLALHGAPGHGANMAEFSGLRELADRKGFIAVFPDGTSAQDPAFLNWNSGSCCGYARDNNINDVDFLRRLILQLAAQYDADGQRIYLAGFSKGGMMAYYFACQHADLIAGIAIVAGAFNLSECNPARPLDVMIVHGRLDSAIPYGGELPARIPPLGETEDRPVSYAVSFWRRLNHCQAAAPANQVKTGSVETVDFPCFRRALRLVTLHDEGHTWPGAGEGLIGAEKARGHFSVNEAIWDFLHGIP